MFMYAKIFIRELWRGKDLYRTLMNIECLAEEVHGTVLDIGGGTGKASYHRFLKRSAQTRIVSLDSVAGSDTDRLFVDLEKDRLPYADGSIDAILAFNIFEHLYNRDHVMAEMRRVLRSGGTVIGAVPFLVGYHADPHDYWRYTDEALVKVFGAMGFKDIHIRVIGRGPFCAAYSQIEFIFPRVLQLFMLPCVLFGDFCLFKAFPKLERRKFALGFFFHFSG